MISSEFDDGRGHDGGGFTTVENEWETIAELIEDFFPAGTSRRVGDVGTGTGQRDAEFGDQVGDYFRFWPTQSDAAGVGSNLEGQAVGRVDDDGEGARPAGVGQAKEIVREILCENHCMTERVDEDGEGAVLGPSFDAKDFVDSREVDRISGESVESVGGDGNDRAAIQPRRSVTDDVRVGIGCADFENLGRQAFTVPILERTW